ncbi:Radical S-adenosyl methionine domain-containing protein 2 [Fusarium oxysporum f. sp. albedinis]|nr:Radical S-adenosyl methionine domain-containing protein 2 [Fusarium oxysporum f. sp. albedinis]
MLPADMEWDTSSLMDDQSNTLTPTSSSVNIRTKSPGFGHPLDCNEGLQFGNAVTEGIHEIVAELQSRFLDTFESYKEVGNRGYGEIASQLHYLSSFITFVNDSANNDTIKKQDGFEITRALVQCTEDTVLAENDMHSIVAYLPIPSNDKKAIIRTFVKANYMLGNQNGRYTSNLFRSSLEGKSRVYAMFGGQGNSDDYFAELAELYDVYQPLVGELVRSASDLFQHLVDKMEAVNCFPEGIDLLAWLEKDKDTPVPSKSYLLSSAVSFPLITLLQLLHFKVSLEFSGCPLNDIQEFLAGATGHSQGIIAAAVIAAVDSPICFHELSMQAITVSFSLGVRIHQCYGPHVLPRATTTMCLEGGHQIPTPMLSVRGLNMEILKKTVEKLNKSLPRTKVQMEVGLKNSASSFVITGDPMSLRGLCTHFDLEYSQNSISSQKQLEVVYQFLPATAPYHNSYLAAAALKAVQDCQGINLRGCDLKLPVFSTVDGSDLRGHGEANIVPDLIRMICCEVVNWPAALNMFDATHILDFGPGGSQGVGLLANSLKSGQGSRVILSTVLNGTSTELGYKGDLFDRSPQTYTLVSRHQPWASAFQPTLARHHGSSRAVVNTRFTRFFLKPPIMVAAMTPTTSSWEFVAAVMNAGYHVELACGGFHDRASLSEAILAISNHVDPGQGITCNVIYSNPTSLRWQIDELQRLAAVGHQIDGLSIGAGVPSVEVVQDYVERLQLRHIALKPGSIEAIERTLKIAEILEPLPIVLQWTGGRGGGHHSNEDFHTPLKSMYGKIRAHENVILIAGSGFGGSSDTLPYITGTWASHMGLPPMPVDGILLGSRVMVAKETRTSPPVKALIVAAQGVPDNEWNSTSSSPTGGVLSVISQMRQPIHKIATRAVRLWHELDQTIFCLTPKERVAEITKRRDEIITRLNSDYHRVWFGCRGPTRDIVDLDEMTYSEVLRRFAELTYARAERRWVHPSWRNLFVEILSRTVSRLHGNRVSQLEIMVDREHDSNDPYSMLTSALATLPDATTQVITYDDSLYFLYLFRHGGHKPVPFIPVLDAEFETWFKKDSLWQSEDIAAVPNQDAQRVCILQGPVAVQYSTKVNEPISDILGHIHGAWVTVLLGDQYDGQSALVPVLESSPLSGTKIASFKHYSQLPTPSLSDGLCTLENWTTHIIYSQDKSLDWAKSLITYPRVLNDRRLVSNPFLAILSGLRTMDIHVSGHSNSSSREGFEFFNRLPDGKHLKILHLSLQNPDDILMEISHYGSEQSTPVTVPQHLSYQLSKLAIANDVTDSSTIMQSFYQRIWFGTSREVDNVSVYDEFEFEPYAVTADAIQKFNECTRITMPTIHGVRVTLEAPLDFAVVIAWKALVRPLFSPELAADILKLLHISNEVTLLPGQSLPVVGDVLHTKSIVTEVTLQSSGKMVEVQVQVFRGKSCTLEIKTRFLLVGNHDHHHLFRRSILPPADLLLKDKTSVEQLTQSPWFQPLIGVSDFVGKSVRFELEHLKLLDEYGRIKCHQISGSIRSGDIIVGKCHLEGADGINLNLIGNIFGQRTDSPSQPSLLRSPIVLLEEEEISFTAPTSQQTVAYSGASGDFNPIHVSPVFASLAGHSTPIVHGMHLSAEVQQLVYIWLCDSTKSRLKKSHVSFVGKVYPEDRLRVSFKHVAMHRGLRVIEVELHKTATEEIVFVGNYEIEQPRTALVFTGQGSQKKGMGMDLYSKSPSARQVWETADDYFQHDYGFRITDIVRKNPRSFTVHFGGLAGRRVRSNYIALASERVQSDGRVLKVNLFPTIDESTASYTYTSESGLLSSTQFTQPAIVLMELAIIADLRARQLIPDDVVYAGHSLGEYSALVALGDIMDLKTLISTVFYRGLVMQSSVTYDDLGRSHFTMAAVDPTRVSKEFDGSKLCSLVARVASEGQWLIEVVNHNVADLQYVCAGETRALHCLGVILDRIHDASRSFPVLDSFNLTKVISQSVDKARHLPPTMTLGRSKAVIPLHGINVPFHSSYLRPDIDAFRKCLQRSIDVEHINPTKLVGHFVPNLTAIPFEVTPKCFEEVFRLTGSIPIKQALERRLDRKWNQVRVKSDQC